MSFENSHLPGATRRPGAREMTALLALLMALNAFAIDAMIPALPDIGRSLHVAEENRRQLVVVAYFVGFGSTQLLWGPLADRFGRKPILAVGVTLYAFFALLCGLASSFASPFVIIALSTPVKDHGTRLKAPNPSGRVVPPEPVVPAPPSRNWNGSQFHFTP